MTYLLFVVFGLVFGLEFGILICRIRTNSDMADGQMRVEFTVTNEEIPELLQSQDKLDHDLSKLLETLKTDPAMNEQHRTELLAIHLTIGIDRTLLEIGPWLQKRGYLLKESSRRLIDEFMARWKALQQAFADYVRSPSETP